MLNMTKYAGGQSLGPEDLLVVPMQREHASEIIDWHYGGAYSFYDLRHYPEDIEEILDADRHGVSLFSVLDPEGNLIGYLNLLDEGENLEIGIELRPDLVGRGLGSGLLHVGMDFATRKFIFKRFMIRVWKLNQRAIKVYEKAGFRIETEFVVDINGVPYRFLRMSRDRDFKPFITRTPSDI